MLIIIDANIISILREIFLTIAAENRAEPREKRKVGKAQFVAFKITKDEINAKITDGS